MNLHKIQRCMDYILHIFKLKEGPDICRALLILPYVQNSDGGQILHRDCIYTYLTFWARCPIRLANNSILDLIKELYKLNKSKVSMYTENSNGPRIEPCGRPHTKGPDKETQSFRDTEFSVWLMRPPNHQPSEPYFKRQQHGTITRVSLL